VDQRADRLDAGCARHRRPNLPKNNNQPRIKEEEEAKKNAARHAQICKGSLCRRIPDILPAAFCSAWHGKGFERPKAPNGPSSHDR